MIRPVLPDTRRDRRARLPPNAHNGSPSARPDHSHSESRRKSVRELTIQISLPPNNEFDWNESNLKPRLLLPMIGKRSSALDIGAGLRAARIKRKLSVRSLAKETGFSPSFLSQVELSQSSPSLASLQRICEALNLDISELLREPNGPARKDPIIRRDDRGVVHSEWSKATMESLLHDAGDDHLSTLLISLEIGGKTGRLPVRSGSQTFAYCVAGRVEITLGQTNHVMSAGDSVLVEEEHVAWNNPGKKKAEVLVVSCRCRT